MRVMITQNVDKSLGVVNGQIAKVIQNNATIFLRLTNNKTVAIHKIHNPHEHAFYPISPSYDLTISKCQGQTLTKTLIYIDTKHMDRAITYVALSRVKKLQDIKLIVPLTRKHFL